MKLSSKFFFIVCLSAIFSSCSLNLPFVSSTDTDSPVQATPSLETEDSGGIAIYSVPSYTEHAKPRSNENLWLPSGVSKEVFLWPESSEVLKQGVEYISNDSDAKLNPHLVVSHPTFFLYPPKVKPTRAAIIVFPGGGYKGVAIGPMSSIGHIGEDVCGWLTGIGITCIVLKYRVPNSGYHWDSNLGRYVTPDISMALQDAQRAISIVRHNADEYDIDPAKIGVIGFSAGGNLAVLSSTSFEPRIYDAIDAADTKSSRPDFVIPVYPSYMMMENKNIDSQNTELKLTATQVLHSDIVVSDGVPPTLLVHAEDDQINPIHFSQLYNKELLGVGVNTKLLNYANGGHAFGVIQQGKDSDKWTVDAIAWLKEINILQ